MNPRFALLTALVALAGAVPTAQAELLLEATFDADEVGAPPDGTLPGGPEGDVLDFRDYGGSITVESEYGSMTDQPLVCHRYTTGFFYTHFVLPETAGECGRYLVTFDIELPTYVFFMNVTLRPGSGPGYMGSLEYRAGGAMSYNSSANPLSVTYEPGVFQSIEIEYDRVAETSSLSIDGVPVPEAQDMLAGSAPFGRVQFSPGGTGDMRYVIDDVRIEGFDCDLVPTRTTSWGMVKALHR